MFKNLTEFLDSGMEFDPRQAWMQISNGDKMACGARDVSFSETSLSFVVGRTKFTRIHIVLSPADTYNVALVRRNTKDPTQSKIVECHTDVYCEDLSNIVYRMVNK